MSFADVLLETGHRSANPRTWQRAAFLALVVGGSLGLLRRRGRERREGD